MVAYTSSEFKRVYNMSHGQEVDITDIQSAVEEIFPEDCPVYA